MFDRLVQFVVEHVAFAGEYGESLSRSCSPSAFLVCEAPSLVSVHRTRSGFLAAASGTRENLL